MAVKIINHDKHVGNNFDALRESVLCSNIQHPNVVMTYKVKSAQMVVLLCGKFRCSLPWQWPRLQLHASVTDRKPAMQLPTTSQIQTPSH